MAISQSTFDDLIQEGHSKKNLVILPMGLTVKVKIKKLPKEKNPTFIYVARLNKQKGIFAVIEAFALIQEQLPEAKLWVVGSATENILIEVNALIALHNLNKNVQLFGFTSEEKKFELLSRAHILLSGSVQEGWGLTIPEAGLCMTPSVVYNTHGFRDIIENGRDGILVNPNPKALAKEAVKVIKDKVYYRSMQLAANKKAKSFSWDKSASVSLVFLKNHE